MVTAVGCAETPGNAHNENWSGVDVTNSSKSLDHDVDRNLFGSSQTVPLRNVKKWGRVLQVGVRTTRYTQPKVTLNV